MQRNGAGRIGVVLGMAVLASGCATAINLPHGPDVFSLAPPPNAPTLLVTPPEDQRSDKQRLGRISALGVTLKENPSELVGREVIAALHARGVNGVLGRADTMTSSSAVGTLAIAIDAMSVSSFDALMDPPTATVSLRATLYDQQGATVQTASAQGQVQRRINTFSAPAAIGQLVGEAVQDAVTRLLDQGAIPQAALQLASTAQPTPSSEELVAQGAPAQETAESPTP